MNHKIIKFPKKKLQDKIKKKIQQNSKMLFLTIVVGAIVGALSWQYFVESVARMDVKIPESKNIIYNHQAPIPMTTAQVVNEFENSDNKPILLYVYATWCKTCSKNFAIINEIAREFQNTELQVIALAIDRDLQPEVLKAYLNHFGDFYFEPRFLTFKEGFVEFLQKKNIRYDNRIPFTVLISSNGDIVTKFSGSKSKRYLRNQVIKELYL